MTPVHTALDLLVLPAHTDCLALVLAEASAAALPAITARVVVRHEVVVDAHHNNRLLLDLVAEMAQARSEPRRAE